MKQLLLLRHAKSDWEAPYGGDHERPLNKRGVRSAALVGRLLADRDQAPQAVISSTAVRARTTAEIAAHTGRWDAGITLDRQLYGTGPGNVLEAAAKAPDVERLMLVGHQPTWSGLVAVLTGASVEMKTATVASIDLMIESWSELLDASGVLTYLINPRMFFGSEYDPEA